MEDDESFPITVEENSFRRINRSSMVRNCLFLKITKKYEKIHIIKSNKNNLNCNNK